MASDALSIEEFYRKGSSSSASPSSKLASDGFSRRELETTNPLSRSWTPTRFYTTSTIENLPQGKAYVCFSGRIVNFKAATLSHSGRQYSRPQHYIVLKDDGSAIGIKLTPLGVPACSFALGQLVTVWATYIGEPPSGPQAIPFVTRCAMVRPSPGTQEFFHLQPDTDSTRSLYRTPLEWEVNGSQPQALPGLMTLGSYLKTGHDDVRGVRILVCVRSIGSRRRVRPSFRDVDIDRIEVTVMDHTASCAMVLWEDQVNSVRTWKAGNTILLITNPSFKSKGGDKSNDAFGLNYATLVDVDPAFTDADWLRKWAKSRTKKECICIPFPENVWDAEVAINGPSRILFTIAELDAFIRSEPHTTFTGKLNLVILDMGILDLWFKKMFFCLECCGVPLYANSQTAICKHCEIEKRLSVNSRCVGMLVDETGCLERGKLVWSDRAWRELMAPWQAISRSQSGGQAAQQCGEIGDALHAVGHLGRQRLEGALMFSRFTMTFGWSPEIERLCVLGVEY